MGSRGVKEVKGVEDSLLGACHSTIIEVPSGNVDPRESRQLTYQGVDGEGEQQGAKRVTLLNAGGGEKEGAKVQVTTAA